MKKLCLVLCVVAIALILIPALGGKPAAEDDVPRIHSVSEAAFSVRNSTCTDATSFLVGSFSTDNGKKLYFNGEGLARRTNVDLTSEEGTCSLTQTEDGAAMLQLTFPGDTQLYSFRLASPGGEFILTDADGVSATYRPVP